MRLIKNNCISRIVSMVVVLMFVFTLFPASLVMADADYTFTLTADKTSVKAGETVNLTVTIDGTMANVSVIQYSVKFNSEEFTTSTSGKTPACFDSTWYAALKEGDGHGVGYINPPQAGINNGALVVAIVSTGGYYIDSGSDLYNATTAEAGKIKFTAVKDIADVSKTFTLENAKIAQNINNTQVEKTVETVQIKGVVKHTVTYTGDYTDTVQVEDGGSVTLPTPPDGYRYEFTVNGEAFTGTEITNITSDITVEVKKIDTAVENVIAKINDIGTVTLESSAKINAARTAYDNLSAEKQALVTNYSILEAAEKKYKELSDAADQEAMDKANAKAVEDLIDAIGDVTIESESKITAAETAYNNLTDSAKAYVTEAKLAVLKKARSDYDALKAAHDKEEADKAAAKKVEDLIDAIGEVELTDACEEKINTAIEAYEKLTDDQLKYFSEAKKTILENAKQKYIDLSEAQTVIDKITAIGTVTTESGDAIEEAESAYVKLSDAQKALVTNYGVLTAARTAYNNLVAAQAVIDKINEIGEVELTDDCKLIIDTARAMYNVLTDAQKELVKNYSELTDAEAEYAKLKQDKADSDAAGAVDALIEAIGEVTLQSKGAIEAAETAYNALTEAQKEFVKNYDTLTAAREAYDALVESAAQEEIDTAAAQGVDALIEAIGEVTLESESKITAAETAYDKLTDAQKQLVTKANDLTAARTAFDELKAENELNLANKAAANAVIAKIDAIGEVTINSLAAIEQAEAAYKELTNAQKELVTNYETLTAAREAYNALVVSQEDQEAANAVIAKINAIGIVTKDSKAAIDEAEAAYNALTSTQKSLVTNYDILEDAKEAYFDLTGPKPSETEDNVYDSGMIVVVIDNIPADRHVTVDGIDAYMVIVNDVVKYVVTAPSSIDTSNIHTSNDGICKKAELGNVNFDSNGVTATDALKVLKKSARIEEEETYFSANPMAYVLADVNGDAKITALDALLVNDLAADKPAAKAKVKLVTTK